MSFIHEGCLLLDVRTVIPLQLRQNILFDLHKTYLGITKRETQARKCGWWPGGLRRYSLCNLYAPREPHKKYLTCCPTVTQPWTRVRLDFVGPFLQHQFLLAVDAYFEWTVILVTDSQQEVDCIIYNDHTHKNVTHMPIRISKISCI